MTSAQVNAGNERIARELGAVVEELAVDTNSDSWEPRAPTGVNRDRASEARREESAFALADPA